MRPLRWGNEVRVQFLFERNRSLAGSLLAGHCYIKSPARQDGMLLICVLASGGSSGWTLPGPDEREISLGRILQSKTV